MKTEELLFSGQPRVTHTLFNCNQKMRNLNVDELSNGTYGRIRRRAVTEPCRHQALLCVPTFPRGAGARGVYSVHSAIFVIAHTALGAAGEEAESAPSSPSPPTDTRAALWRSRSPRSDSRRRSHKHSPAWREDGIMGFFCFCSPLCRIFNGTLSRPPISIRPNTSRWKLPTASAALYLSIYPSNYLKILKPCRMYEKSFGPEHHSVSQRLPAMKLAPKG